MRLSFLLQLGDKYDIPPKYTLTSLLWHSSILLRAWALLIRFILPPQALVTTVAVKFKAMGMFTELHMGSTEIGFEAGITPASWPDALRTQAPPELTTLPPSTVMKQASTKV